MAVTTTAISYGGNMNFAYKAWSSSTPATLPALADYSTTVPSGWTDFGATDGGVDLSIATETEGLEVDQLTTDVATIITGQDITVGGDLAQAEPSNLQVAAGQGTITNVAPGAGTRGSNTLEITGSPSFNFYAILVQHDNPGDSEMREVLVPKGQPSGTVTMTMGQKTEKTMITAEFTALPDTNNKVLVYRDTIPATS